MIRRCLVFFLGQGLILVAAATAARSGISTAAGWAQSRLEPRVDQSVEVRLYDLTSQVELTAFDDPDFHERMQRARDGDCIRRRRS